MQIMHTYMRTCTHTVMCAYIHLHSRPTVLRTLITQLKQKKDIESQSLFHPEAFGYFVDFSYFFHSYSFTYNSFLG